VSSEEEIRRKLNCELGKYYFLEDEDFESDTIVEDVTNNKKKSEF
jgi:hypothetical protein